jgi:hypothetical protein
MRKISRVTLSILVGLLAGVLCKRTATAEYVYSAVHEALGGELHSLSNYAVSGTVAFGLVPLVIALLMHELLEPSDERCRCRGCGAVLGGLSEPKCPSCGERI